jgi:hypothetical protein
MSEADLDLDRPGAREQRGEIERPLRRTRRQGAKAMGVGLGCRTDYGHHARRS